MPVARYKIERAIEIIILATGLLLFSVGYMNLNTLMSGGCGRISCGPTLYDPLYRLAFFIGIIATIMGAVGLSWNVISRVGRTPPKD